MTRPEGLIPGALAGSVGGLVFGAAMIELGVLDSIASLVRANSPVLGFFVHMVVAVLIGAGFGVLVGTQRPEAGETLLWGLAYGAAWWFIGAVTLLPLLSGDQIAWEVEAARELLPALIGHLLYGVVTALAFVVIRNTRAPTVEPGALVRGGLAGLVASLLLGFTLESQAGLPAVSAAMTDNSRPIAWTITIIVGVLAGVGYAALFPSAGGGVGPGLIRGMVYGFLWWVVAALTLLPLLDGSGLRWSIDDVRMGFATFPGYLLILGAFMTFIYHLLTRLNRALFSDDISSHSGEGIGTRGLRAIGRGTAAGLAGGIVFTFVMVQIGFLGTVAGLIGRESPVVGFLVHLMIAMFVGVAYGVLFIRRSNDAGSALGWGMSYGVLWWLLGPLTLLPVLLGEAPQWTVRAAIDTYPALIGHLGYGAFLGLTFYSLESRHSPWWIARSEAEAAKAARAEAQLLSTAPGLWALAVLIALTIPLLLAG